MSGKGPRDPRPGEAGTADAAKQADVRRPPPGATRGRLAPPWDTDLGCSTDFFYLHHRCSCSPEPPPPPPRLVVCRGASPTPPPPAKQATPTVRPRPRLTDCLTLALPLTWVPCSAGRPHVPVLTGPAPSRAPVTARDPEGLPTPLPELMAQGPAGPRRRDGLPERLRGSEAPGGLCRVPERPCQTPLLSAMGRSPFLSLPSHRFPPPK